ncbi:hypothetical protein Moror_11753 [Moniliophthora roreri MCA 2997]|uniref:Uncharacterized protein n=1 Tax=Moniliophthora roreri (strain MCA 2997) TaxID=1381753 RepID=V2XUB9_MONRO|nr:hypothetical protein Moror_11753 [Moniliophthora roreri MCA 2997]
MPLLAAAPPPLSSSSPSFASTSSMNGFKSNNTPEDTPQSTSRIPTVRLDVTVIDDSIAARLATSLINHVLFLKSQVPLPIVILNKQRQTNTKADKPRLELLNSLDTLSSHLDTTFTALSTAFAKCKSSPKTQPAYLAILVGPSITSAKQKVLFGVDGLEAKIWGVRDDLLEQVDDVEGSDEESDEEDEEECDSSTGSGDEHPEDSASESEEEEKSEDDEPEPLKPLSSSQNRNSPPRRQPHLVSIQSQTSHTEQQQLLHRADRLFSSTLARAEGEGRGMSAEMPPTQTHILIRAPRRYNHPAWIPRQNVGRTMERVLEEFLADLHSRSETCPLPAKTKKGSSKVEGVWVTAREAVKEDKTEAEDAEVVEDDEMIWWSWDRELVGFS